MICCPFRVPLTLKNIPGSPWKAPLTLFAQPYFQILIVYKIEDPPDDIRIGAVLRKDDVIIPTSKFIFEKKDTVVFLAKRDQLSLVERLFQISSI